MSSSWAQGYSFIPPAHIGPAATVILVLGLLGAGYGAVLVTAISLWFGLRRARDEERALLDEPATRLRPGPRRMVRGKVERTGAGEAPVEVDILEMVHDHSSKQAKWHTWEETTRSVRAEPFRLLRDDGSVVTVEPGQDVLVVDSLTSTYPQDRPLHRVRSAIIAHGAEVHVYGDLHRTTSAAEGPYRESGAGFALRPPRGGPMLIATESLRARHDGVIRALSSWLVVGLAAFVLLHGIITLPFLLTSAFHDDADAQVQSTRIVTKHTKNGYVYTYLVTVRTADGFVLKDQEVPPTTYQAIVQRGNGSFVANPVTLPILRTFDSQTLSFVGTEPHMSTVPPIGALLLLSVCAIGAFFNCRAKLCWYDMKKVTEPGGDGHWEEPRPERPVIAMDGR